ncbi:MAG TPA: hypothetical protein VHG91_12685 [Longimicrobium sp.]|nr:hypothetical protein [Longimicrobium sp.]
MKKLRLDLDALRVDSFEADGEEAEWGTVAGYGRGPHRDAGPGAARDSTLSVLRPCFATEAPSCRC